MKEKYIFLDLDDTLADTSKSIEILFKYNKYKINDKLKAKGFSIFKDFLSWSWIKRNELFWSNIPLRKEAIKIYEESLNIVKKKENIYVLSALPKLIFKKNSNSFKKAAKEKINWVKKNFPEIREENILIVYAKDKKTYINNVNGIAILIDDSVNNIDGWKKNGGIGILVEDEKCTIKKIKDIYES